MFIAIQESSYINSNFPLIPFVHGHVVMNKNTLQWTYLDLTKGNFFGLDTYYW